MRKFSLILLLSMMLGGPVFSQGVLNVRINEVLVQNEENIIDDYGTRESWIELFNTGYESVNIGGCCLAIRYADRYDAQGNQLIKKYYIPRDDPSTQMSSLEYKVFFCEGTDTKGTYYTNFTLGEEKIDMVILYNSNGKDVISIFRFPENYQPIADVSWGIIGHNEPESFVFPEFSRRERKELQARGEDVYLNAIAANLKYQPQELSRTTPNATNEQSAEIPRHEIFRQSDPSGLVMAVVAMGVVFLALILIFLVIKYFGKFMVARDNRKEVKTTGTPAADKITKPSKSGEEIAAIALAIQLYQQDLHVKEAAVITINRVGRIYSPWSSKIYGLRQFPNKK